MGKTLIVGYGSIGRRHARIAAEEGDNVAVVSSQSDTIYPVFKTLGHALERWQPTIIIVATPTHNHLACLRAIEETVEGCRVLVEKPLFAQHQEFQGKKNSYFVGYNLRLHPVVKRVKSWLRSRRLEGIQCSVGSYLPSWRPGRDYRDTYSADKERGGGVLLDLCHELDLLTYWCGPPECVGSLLFRASDLEINSEDTCIILARMPNGAAASIHMDYISRIPLREGVLHASGATLKYNLIAGSIISSDGLDETLSVDRDNLYREQIRRLKEGGEHLCTLEEGLLQMHLIDLIRKSSSQHRFFQTTNIM